MKYDKFFSDDVPSFMRSPVREIFKKVDLAAIYSFAGGYPDAATFPIDDIRRISAQVLEKYGAKALQYGATQGVPELREVVARRCGVAVEFRPLPDGSGVTDVYLTGPAEEVVM